jgi:hypothetical protein
MSMSGHSSDQPSVLITDELISTLVATGGYTHPLFNPNGLDGAARPLPGQAVLLLMGGLVEQSGLLDRAIALLELKRVRFEKMVHAGSRLGVEIIEGERSQTSSGKTLQEFTWIAHDQSGQHCARAEVLMLMDDGDRGEQ